MSENQFYSTCFKPLDLWMRILGIELDPLDSSRTIGSRIFSFLMIFINVSTNLCFVALTFNQQIFFNLPIWNSKGSPSEFWAMVIDLGNFPILTIGVHGALLFLTQNSEWKLLWANLQQLASRNGELFYSKSRKIVLASLLLIIADCGINLIQVILKALQVDGRPLLTKLFDFISYLSQIYGVSGLVLFATIGWITSEGFAQLRHQVIGLDSNSIRLNPPTSSSDLNQLRRVFLTLSETVLHIQHCFGPILFFWITFIFISIIANSFYLVQSVSENLKHSSDVPFWISVVTRNLIFLFVLTSIPITLQRESLNIWKSLRKMRFDDPSLQCQLDGIAMEVLQSPTEMTAMDLFQVNLTLFPKLIGTTLTYLIILSQFQSKD